MRGALLIAITLSACAPEPRDTPIPEGDAGVPTIPTCGETELPTTAGACVPVGVDACDEGFELDGRGGCRAILPATCPAGQLAIPGDTACRPVDDCSTVAPADAIHVDAAASSPGDGTSGKPFKTIAEALEAAKTREGTPTVFVGKGSYTEQLVAPRAVRVLGACASTTELVAPEGPGSFAFASAFPFEISHIAIRRGDAGGIVLVGQPVAGAPAESAAVVDHVWVRGTNGIAIGAQAGPRPVTLTVRDSLIEDVTETGISLVGATGVVERTVIRRVAPPTEHPPYGAYVGGAGGKLTIKRSVIESSSHGVGVLGAEVHLEGSVLRDLRPDDGRESSVGVSLDGVKGVMFVSGSVIERATLAGVLILRGSATIERATIADVRPGSAIGVGEGVHVGRGGNLVMRRSLVASTVAHGLVVADGDATLEKVIVRDTAARLVEKDFGAGIVAQPETASSHVTLREVVVRGTFIAGVQINGATLDIESAFISDVRAQQVDGLFGDGIALQSSKRRTDGELFVGRANVTGLIVKNAKRAGIGVFGAELVLSSSMLSCNAIDLAITDRFDSNGVASNPSSIRDGGSNLCGCGSFGVCTARAEALAPSPHLNE